MLVSAAILIDSLTDCVKTDLQNIAVELRKLDNREDKVQFYEELFKYVNVETFIFIELATRREEEHITFMKHILSEFPEFDDRKSHDYSKDSLFYYVAASWFTAKVRSREMKYLIESELIRHYALEPHHPEFEKFNSCECTKIDIKECALDRLSRNLQFSGEDVVNLDIIKKFTPVFPKGDNEKKQALFWDTVLEYKDFIEYEWSMFST